MGQAAARFDDCAHNAIRGCPLCLAKMPIGAVTLAGLATCDPRNRCSGDAFRGRAGHKVLNSSVPTCPATRRVSTKRWPLPEPDDTLFLPLFLFIRRRRMGGWTRVEQAAKDKAFTARRQCRHPDVYGWAYTRTGASLLVSFPSHDNSTGAIDDCKPLVS